MKVEIYSDIACPWCYIGKTRFDKALAAFPKRDEVEVVYKAYQLNPDLSTDPEQAIPHDAYLMARFGPGFKQMAQNVTEIAAKEGLDFHTDKALMANTFDAHRLLRLADQVGGASLKQRLLGVLFAAQFTHGENLADPQKLAALATGIGLDARQVGDYLASDEGATAVSMEIAEGRSVGITGVPTFVFEGKWKISGAQEVETFLSILEQVASEIAAMPPEAGGQACQDESCSV